MGKTLITLVMMLLPCAALAATNCRVFEYPDHFEALCLGDAPQTEASFHETWRVKNGGKELILASDRTSVSAETDVPPEKIVMNNLGRLHAAALLRRMPGH
jgi:hypothetical protein